MSSSQGFKGLGYGMSEADADRVMEKAGVTREEAQALHEKMTERHPALGDTLKGLQNPQETLDELRERLVARLDATSWARNEFSDERVAKQVIVVRTDLKMRKGKMGAQIGHAVMKVFLDRVQGEPVTSYGETRARAIGRPHPAFTDRYDRPVEPGMSPVHGDITIPLNAPMMDWLMGRFTKVCCRAESEEELLRICDAALEARLSCALIQDAGLTEFKGQPTLTCCAIGPAYSKDLDPVTGHLKLP